MNINKIEDFKKRISVCKDRVSDKRARIKVMKENLKAIKESIRKAGISSIAELDKRILDLEGKFSRLSEDVEKKLSSIEEKLND